MLLYHRRFIRFIFIFTSTSSICFAQISSSEVDSETATLEPLTSCDPPWRQHNSKCYYTTSQGSTLSQAKQACKKLGADLAKPDSAEEHIFIRRILVSYNDSWIGAVDNENKEKWWDGSPMLYQNFQDSNASCPVPCCGLTTNRHGQWNYAACNSVLNFVCVKTNETIAAFRRSTQVVHVHPVSAEELSKDNDEDGSHSEPPQADGNESELEEVINGEMKDPSKSRSRQSALMSKWIFSPWIVLVLLQTWIKV